MRLIDADKGLISKIQLKTGCNFITAQKIVDSMLTVEEHKVGKWINKTHKSGCGILFVASECTCCRKKTLFNCDELLYNYCPNCGAEMRGSENVSS